MPIILLVLIGILLVMPAGADYYSQIMPIDIEEEIKCEREIWELVKARNLEIPVETIKIIVKEDEKAKMKFKATISCESCLRVLSVNQDGEISSCCFNSRKSIKGGGCYVRGEFSLPVGIYTCIFISPGDNGYGVENKGWIEFLIFCQNLYEQRDHEQALREIVETAGALRSRDSINIKKIIVGEDEDYSSGYRFLPGKSIKIQRCLAKEGKMRVAGKTNLDDSDMAWTFSAKGFKIDGQTKIKSDNTFSFVINCVGAKGDYSLTLKVDDTTEFFTGKLPTKSSIKIQPTPTPRAVSKSVTKIIPKPTVRPEIKITPRPTFALTPAVIKYTAAKQKIPVPTPTPKTNHSILASIAGIAIVIFLKKFRNAFD